MTRFDSAELSKVNYCCCCVLSFFYFAAEIKLKLVDRGELNLHKYYYFIVHLTNYPTHQFFTKKSARNK